MSCRKCNPQPTAVGVSALTYSRSQDLYPTHWCDVFDINSPVGYGWMLLDLPEAPCDVTKMRTMTQRLRKAQECAAAGGKYGLVQAVLLSLDSQPIRPAHWLRQSVALEACSKVLLPAAHEAQVDLGAARAAYQQLTPAEQRLWRQLQAARIQLKRGAKHEPGSTEGYLLDTCYMANVVAGVTGDTTQLAQEVIRQLMLECRWEVVCRMVLRYDLFDNRSAPLSMQAAYNWALACYLHHGEDHPETWAAHEAMEEADPSGWVPALLAGMSYPPLCMAPASVPGSRMEAAGYAHHFGCLWAASGEQLKAGKAQAVPRCYGQYSRQLLWLLKVRSLMVPTSQQQRELASVRLLACGDLVAAHEREEWAMRSIVHILSTKPWPECRPLLEQSGVARHLRALAVTIMAMASKTMNLPPIAVAPWLWKGVHPGMEEAVVVALSVQSLGMNLAPYAATIISWYVEEHPPATEAAAAALGFWLPGELEELRFLGFSFIIASMRWLWQCGDAAYTQQPGSIWLELLSDFRDKLNRGDTEAWPAALLQQMAQDGVMPAGPQPVEALAQFLAQEKARQVPGTGLELIDGARAVAERQGYAAGAHILSSGGHPEEQQLHNLFPQYVNQLMSHVMGRRVSLVIEPKSAHGFSYMPHLPCRLYLKDAATGDKQVFGWQQPGDVNGVASYLALVQAARQQGVIDPDLLRYCAGVEQVGATSTAHGPGSQQNISSRLRLFALGSRAAWGAIEASGMSPVNPSMPPAAAGRPPAARKASTTQAAAGQQAAGAGGKGAAASSNPTSSSSSGRDKGSSSSSLQAKEGLNVSKLTAAVAAATLAPGASGADSSGSSHHSSQGKPCKPCAKCGELFPKLKQCTRCKAVSYCSKECQVAHWKAGHKQVCKEQPAD